MSNIKELNDLIQDSIRVSNILICSDNFLSITVYKNLYKIKDILNYGTYTYIVFNILPCNDYDKNKEIIQVRKII